MQTRVIAQPINAINTSSRNITDINGVIDSIAFETNILAIDAESNTPTAVIF